MPQLLAPTVTDRVRHVRRQTISCLSLMFIQGLVFMMITYTNKSLARLLLPLSEQKYSVILAIPQVTGDLITCFTTSMMLKRFNIRWLFLGGFGLTTVALIFLSCFDYLVGVHGVSFNQVSDATRTKALTTYIVLGFLVGVGTAYTTGTISNFLGTIYSAQRRTLFISAANGIYGIGAGFVPLVLSNLIFVLNSVDTFNLLRAFLITATIASFLACCSALLLNYHFGRQGHDLSWTVSNKHHTSTIHHQYLLAKIGVYIILCLLFFDTIQVNAGIGLNNYVSNHHSRYQMINLIRGIGLYFFIQGLWSFISPLLFGKVKHRYYVLIMAVFCAIGFGLLAGNLLTKDIQFIYLVVLFLGIGIGNTWSVIFAFFQSTIEQKRALMGVILSVGRMLTYEVAIFIIGFIPNRLGGSRMILTVVIAGLMFLVPVLMSCFESMVRKHKLS